jgi:hypothetical protein
MILNWCQSGIDINADHITGRIGDCKSIEELLTLYKMFPQFQGALHSEYERKKRELIISTPSDETKHLSTTKTYTNGTV